MVSGYLAGLDADAFGRQDPERGLADADTSPIARLPVLRADRGPVEGVAYLLQLHLGLGFAQRAAQPSQIAVTDSYTQSCCCRVVGG